MKIQCFLNDKRLSLCYEDHCFLYTINSREVCENKMGKGKHAENLDFLLFQQYFI